MSSSSFAEKVFERATEPGRILMARGADMIFNIPIPGILVGFPLIFAGAMVEVVGRGVAVGVVIASPLVNWALGPGEATSTLLDPELINNERRKENFQKGRIHIAICGQTGSGKSSIINALRGIQNSQVGAARVGTTETTISRATYPAHESFSSVTLHDIPGAGTRRTPAENYYDNQKLFLFDLLLVAHSGRLGQVDIEIVKNCVRIQQPFLIIRSKSDISISSIVNDTDLDQEAAKAQHMKTSLAALRAELSKAGVPEDSIKDIVNHCILINNQALRKCVLGQGDSVINELELVRFLTTFIASFQQGWMQGRYWLRQLDNGRYCNEQYIGHLELKEDMAVIVTYAQILLIRSKPLTIEWGCRSRLLSKLRRSAQVLA
ncbi:hypothetical protein TrVFT333_006282 [Trichoderma virens FT-333]|nr:hypothetical protein TrVFT333_006282 [Trichoderma virens FT-333]